MPPQTSAQKAAVSNFVAITGAFFQANGGGSGAASGPNKDAQLNQLFDSLRNEREDGKDTLGADSAMGYLQSIGVGLEDASLFLAVELLQAPSIGEIPRAGFVCGWGEAGVEVKTEAQATHLKHLAGLMARERDLFRKVYRYAFVAGKEGEQRALSLEMALLYWDTLFKRPGQSWVGSSTKIDWLNEWRNFLQENWKRSVNRDMWNQTLEFAFKSIDDESLGFWSEDGAWPGVIDEFVAWYKRKCEMELDA
ncbi:hypothetical protein GQX73_g10604 [Xylaria multiplex]|uniref:Defective in cullin neddylation protein n=1 Tax=Xylaria multiplex TaxID=323545 RepID=A0A7C8MJJ6_9PEZI|nr:hypothetical protein GQX73_g10604 [Xylaria multiplex]